MRTLHPSSLDLEISAPTTNLPIPGCDCADCKAALEPEFPPNESRAGCGPWLLLLVGYIVVLSAIGISAIILTS